MIRSEAKMLRVFQCRELAGPSLESGFSLVCGSIGFMCGQDHHVLHIPCAGLVPLPIKLREVSGNVSPVTTNSIAAMIRRAIKTHSKPPVPWATAPPMSGPMAEMAGTVAEPPILCKALSAINTP